MLHSSIQSRLQAAVTAVLPDANVSTVLVRPCPDPKFGDYQSNALMALAKERKMNPRQLANDVVAKLDVSEWCEKVDIAGAGFLNFRLKPSAIAETLQSAAQGEHLFFQKAAKPRTVVIDFSSPNVAKPMHVGHIRSTILGDSLARTLRLLGHRVITDNHIGDWGTQFGMLLVGWKRFKLAQPAAAINIDVLVTIYKGIQSEIKSQTRETVTHLFPEDFQQLLAAGIGEDKAIEQLAARVDTKSGTVLSTTEVESRAELVKLQSGDAENLAIWREMIALSLTEFDSVYDRLGVKFDHTYGESFYNPMLKGVVQELREKGIATESEGAICVFSDGKLPPKQDPFLKQEDDEWKPNPALIQKSDGAANYATTDLATLAYRLQTWHPDAIAYVTDGRQQLHFQQIFATFQRWHPEVPTRLEHVWFGSILGDDKKPFKTRSGETVKLADLLDEAEERAFKVVTEKAQEREVSLSESERKEIARVVGIGAVKFADLLPNRQSDYVFSWDKMLAFNGTSAPYLLNAFARVRSIFRKAGGGYDSSAAILLNAPLELALAKHLLHFGLVLEAVSEEYRPNFLCNYLYELAGHFARFYEACPVLTAEPAERASRLVLCDLTAKVLKQGLDVLGIETLEQM